MKLKTLSVAIALISGLYLTSNANATFFDGKKCSAVSNPFCKNK